MWPTLDRPRSIESSWKFLLQISIGNSADKSVQWPGYVSAIVVISRYCPPPLRRRANMTTNIPQSDQQTTPTLIVNAGANCRGITESPHHQCLPAGGDGKVSPSMHRTFSSGQYLLKTIHIYTGSLYARRQYDCSLALQPFRMASVVAQCPLDL